MATVPTWFDGNTYMKNKLALLQESDATFTYSKMLDAFTAAGYIEEEGYYQHFLDYGKHEGVSPNALFDNAQYMQFKAISFFTSDEAGDKKVDEQTVRDNMQYYAGQIKQAFDDAGMSAWEHYEQYGGKEGINTSNNFDDSNYIDAKVDALAAAGITKDDGSAYTANDVRQAIADAGMTPLTHFETYKGGEGEVAESATFAVPADEQVSTDSSAGEGTLFALSAQTDTLAPNAAEAKYQTTSGDDEIIAAAGTIQAADYIDGDGGQDTLMISGANAVEVADAAPTLKNVEIIESTVAMGNALGLGNSTGLEKLVVKPSGAAADVVVSGAPLTEIEFDGSGFAGTATVTWAGSALAGATTLNVTDNLSGAVATVNAGAATTGLETIAVTGTGSALTLGANITTGLTKVTFNVDNVMTFTQDDAQTKLSTVDASASSGAIRFTGNANVDVATTVKGGAGDDVIDMKAAVVACTIEGGNGNDILIGGTKADVIRAGDGDDKVGTSALADQIYLGSGQDTVSVTALADSIATADKFATVKDFSHADGDVVDFGTGARATAEQHAQLLQATSALTANSTLDDIIAAVTAGYAAAAGTKYADFFTVGSDTYVVYNDANDAAFEAADFMIKLEGVTDFALTDIHVA